MEQPTRCTGLTRLVGTVKLLLHETIRALPAIVRLLRDLTRTQEQLMSVRKLLNWDSIGRPPKRWRSQSGICSHPTTKCQGQASPVPCCLLSLFFQVFRLLTDLVSRDCLGETQGRLVRV